MPALQGLIFTVGTICVALIIGLPLGYALFSYAKHNGIFGMNVYHVPLIPILVMILLVGILQIVLSCVLSSNLKKETLVERIRYQGQQVLLGYPQYHSGDNEYSYCNLLWGMDKISYFYKSHYVVATGTYGLYRNQMLCERTGTLLGNKQDIEKMMM